MGPALEKSVIERRAIMAASIFGSSFVPPPGVFRGWLLNKKMTRDARRGRTRGGRTGEGLRGEETNQMLKRDGSPSRLCVFSGKGRRVYSGAGDCSNNIPPQHTALPLFLLWGDLFFPLPCYIGLALLRMDKVGEGCVIKVSLFFSVSPLRLCQIWVIRSDLSAVFNLRGKKVAFGKEFKPQACLRATGKGIIHMSNHLQDEDQTALCRSY